MLPTRLPLLLGVCLLLCLGCRNPPPAPVEDTGPPWFEDVTSARGIDFVHDPGPLGGLYPMPQIVGSGGALCDLDGDGRLDVLLLNNGGPDGRPNVLYRQKDNGTFEDVSRGSGLDVAGHGMGVAVGDVDGDGLFDLAITHLGAEQSGRPGLVIALFSL